MLFDYNIPPLTITLLATTLLCLLITLIIYCRRINRVTRAVKNADSDTLPDPTTMQPASIVIYAQDQTSWLEELLPDLLAQDYPAGFEIIVVNEGGSDATRDLVERLAITHPNLYLTYTPDGARNLSRKKLALTIGIKAAANPVIVNITAATRVESPLWLRHIMHHFDQAGIEVIIGYAYPAPTDDTYGRRRRAFDYVADAVTWLTAALSHHPYRGTEMNIAYTRDIFFRNKGFSRSLNLVNGDDDIFINQITTPYNTAVALAPESMTMANFRDHRAAHNDTRCRHAFTARRLPRTSTLLMNIGALTLWIQLATAGTACLIDPTNLFPVAVAAPIVIATLLCVTIAWRRVMIALRSRTMFWTLPRLAMFRPLRALTLALRASRSHTHNYTWK